MAEENLNMEQISDEGKRRGKKMRENLMHLSGATAGLWHHYGWIDFENIHSTW